MSTDKTDADLAEDLATLKAEITALKKSIADKARDVDMKAKEIDAKDLRRFMAQEAKRLGLDRKTDLEALREDGARAVRLARRNPGTTVGLAAAIGFCAGLLVARR